MSHLSVVELENELGPRLFAAEHGGAPPVMFAGRYELLRIRGHGARGLVVKARDKRLDRVVALKLYPYPEDAALLREVEIEARATARLEDHPNVVRLHDVGHAELQHGERNIPCLFISMAYIDGASARAWLAEGPPREEILRVFLAAAEGLAAAHERGIVHRDIKPENIVIDPAVGAKIVDFGLARARRGGEEPRQVSQHTEIGVIKGTFEYMAPEARRGQADVRSDQFSFAVALWEALTGVLPFDPSRGEWRLGHERDFAGAERLPPALAEPLRRALAYHVEDRFTSMRELITALRHDEEPAALSGPSRPTLAAAIREPAPPASSSRWLFALPVFAAVAYGGYTWLTAESPVAEAEPAPASSPVAEPSAPVCAAAPFEGRWRFNTRVLWADDSYWIGVEGFYWLTVEVGDDCAVQATFERFGDSGNRKYDKAQRVQTTLTLEREPAGAVWLTGEAPVVSKDKPHRYHLALAEDGSLVGDWSYRERSDRPTMTGILRGARGESAGHVPSDLSDSPCLSSCRIRCAGAAAVEACVTSACVVGATASTHTCAPDPDAPPPILAQDLIVKLREEKPVNLTPHTKCQEYGRYLAGRWTVWQNREQFTLKLTVDGCELRGTIRAKNGSLIYKATGHVTVHGQWYLRPVGGVSAPLWALSRRDPAFGLTSTYPRAVLAAHKAR
jgi:hypothetical protein